jgi:transposase-like protein
MNYSREERAKLLEGWRRSGKSISAYVKEKDLVRWTFTRWLKAKRDAEPDAKSGFVEVPAAALNPMAHARRILQSTRHVQEILIEKGDIKIHIPMGTGSGELRAVMEWLGVAV